MIMWKKLKFLAVLTRKKGKFSSSSLAAYLSCNSKKFIHELGVCVLNIFRQKLVVALWHGDIKKYLLNSFLRVKEEERR